MCRREFYNFACGLDQPFVQQLPHPRPDQTRIEVQRDGQVLVGHWTVRLGEGAEDGLPL